MRNYLNKIDNTINLLFLIHYIPNDKEKKYIEKRKLIFEFCKIVWNGNISNQKNGNQIPEELYIGVDDFIINNIIQKIEETEQITRKYDIYFIVKFIKFLLEYYPNEIDRRKIIPNQNGKFCEKSKLFKDLFQKH